MTEIWKEIPGFAGRYLASTHGQIKAAGQVVRNCPRGVWYERVIPERVLKTNIGRNGYKRTTLTYEGKPQLWLVHRLIAMTFLPNPGGLPCVNHIDACKLNNRVENLEWVTHAENMAHAARLGLMPSMSGPGMDSPAAKLTDDCVRAIKHRLAEGEGPTSIAMDYPVSPSAIGEIKAGRSWAHIKRVGCEEVPA
ncbi:NUMOD4 domain-containing protein [Pseudomonas sp. Marseille-QA0892]